MSYIGNTSTTQAFTPAVDFFNGNGSTTAFTLSRPVASVAQVQAVISNVPQKPGDAFTVSGNTITFTSAPPSGTQNIYVYYTSPITQVIAPGQNTVGTTQIQDNAITTAKIAAGAVVPADLSTGAPAWDTSGNMALNGATPSAWESAWKAFDVGALGSVAYGYGETNVLTNLYRINTGAYKYKTTAAAAVYTQAGSSHNFGSFASGSAGATATIVPVLSFDKDKTLALQGATSATGTGIAFPATQSASSDANTLDDYEEGTWTPTLVSSGGGQTVTYTYQTGSYVKIGSVVQFNLFIKINTKSGGSGTAQISNLPFSTMARSGFLDYTMCCQVVAASTLYASNTIQGSTIYNIGVTFASLANGDELRVSGVYQTF
jgi:hypothetical protein